MIFNNNPNIGIKDSPIQGKGLFTTGTIKKGEVVVYWNPKVLSREEASKL